MDALPIAAQQPRPGSRPPSSQSKRTDASESRSRPNSAAVVAPGTPGDSALMPSPAVLSPMVKPTSTGDAISELFDLMHDDDVENEPLHHLRCEVDVTNLPTATRVPAVDDVNPAPAPGHNTFQSFSTFTTQLSSGMTDDDLFDISELNEDDDDSNGIAKRVSVHSKLRSRLADANNASMFFLHSLGQLFELHEKLMAAAGGDNIATNFSANGALAGGGTKAPHAIVPETDANWKEMRSVLIPPGSSYEHRALWSDADVTASPQTNGGNGFRSLLSATATPYKLFRQWRRGSAYSATDGSVASDSSIAAGYGSDSETSSRAFRGNGLATSASGGSVICFGFLKKAKDLNLGMWHSKYVEIRPGMMVYASDPGDINNPKRSSSIILSPRTSVFRNVTTYVGLINCCS